MTTPATNNPTPIVELRHVAKSYTEAGRSHVIYRDLNAVFRQGESVALLGRSGSGKSTLLNLISGIDLPDTGAIIVNDFNVAQASEKQRTIFRRRNIGFIFQSFNLIPTLTVLENVVLPLELCHGSKGQHRTTALAALESVQLADRAETFPDQLSGGEQQRVAIVRAIVHRPTLLLADEPTGNLDLDTGAQVVALLRQLVQQFATTLLLVTHSVELARSTDRVLRVESGALVEAAQ